jgi:hypothetical protein
MRLQLSVLCIALVGCATGADEQELEPDSTGNAGAGGTFEAGPSGPGPTGPGSGGSMGPGPGAGGSGASGGGGGEGAAGGEGGAGGSPSTLATKVLFMNGGGTATIGSYTDVVSLNGWSTPLLTPTVDPIGISPVNSGFGAALFRDANTGELFATYFSGMLWSPPTAPAAGLLAGPGGSALVYDGTVLHAVYRLGDAHLYAARDGAIWTATAEPVGSSGPTASALALDGVDPVILFVGADGELYDQTRAAGTWQPANAHALAGSVAAIRPAIVTLASGPELLAVYVDGATQALMWTARSVGTWSAPAALGGALSADPPSLAALPNGDAVVAYRDTTSKSHAARFSAGSWGAPSELTGANSDTICPPVVSQGAQGADAELLYVDSIGATYWTRLTGSTLTPKGLAGTASPPSCAAIAVTP